MGKIFERGIVTVYDSFKGYGFIRRKKGKDVFFHYCDIKNKQEPAPGDILQFLVIQKPKGPCAQEIMIIDENIKIDGLSS